MAKGPVSVLSPTFQRYLDTGAAPRSPPPAPCIAVCSGTSPRDAVQLVDASTDAIIITVDKAVHAVVEHCDVSTEHDPAVESPTVVRASVDDVPASVDLDVVPTALLSAGSTESVVDPQGDFPVDGSLVAENTPETAASVSDFVPLVTSPMGPALVDSDDELIATRLPGYLNSFRPCEVFVQQFLSFVFLFPFLTFSLFVRFLQVFHFSSFSHFLKLSIGVFSLFAFLDTFRSFHLFYIFVFFLWCWSSFTLFLFSFTSLSHPSVFFLKSFYFRSGGPYNHLLFIFSFFLRYSFVFPA